MRLDLRELRREGLLQPGTVTRYYWHDPFRREVVGVALLSAQEDALVVRAAVAGSGPREGAIPLQWTACRLGGRRPWLLCPGCHTKRLVLFSLDGWFDCATCLGVRYRSTRLGKAKRLRRRLAVVEERLSRKGLRSATSAPLWREFFQIAPIVNAHQRARLAAIMGGSGFAPDEIAVALDTPHEVG